MTVRAKTAVSPQNRFKKTTAGIFIFKSCFELVDIHGLASLNGFAGKPITGL
jgi:hypothetical protein